MGTSTSDFQERGMNLPRWLPIHGASGPLPSFLDRRGLSLVRQNHSFRIPARFFWGGAVGAKVASRRISAAGPQIGPASAHINAGTFLVVVYRCVVRRSIRGHFIRSYLSVVCLPAQAPGSNLLSCLQRSFQKTSGADQFRSACQAC